jgi:hypothetical protein
MNVDPESFGERAGIGGHRLELSFSGLIRLQHHLDGPMTVF